MEKRKKNGMLLELKNLKAGMFSNKGWYAATWQKGETAEMVKKPRDLGLTRLRFDHYLKEKEKKRE